MIVNSNGNYMKKLIPIFFCLFLLGCSKKNDTSIGVKVTLHYTITSDNPGQKFVSTTGGSSNDRVNQNFTSLTYDGDVDATTGITYTLSTGYSATDATDNIHVVITKNGSTIADQSGHQRIDISAVAQ